MPSLPSPAPLHLLTYSALLGAELYQSFVSGIIAFRCLPRPHFARLQEKTFPIYFLLQTLLPLVLLLTYPAPGSPHRWSPALAAPNMAGWVWTVAAAGAVNAVCVGPATTRVMRERKALETREGRRADDPGPQSEGMRRLNRRFGVWHGVSSVLNLVAVGATVGYGVVLAGRLG